MARRELSNTGMKKMENLEIFDPFSNDLNLKVTTRIESFLAD